MAADDTVGQLNFCAADGTDLNSRAASITVQIDGTPGANDVPGRLHFATTADGASSPTNRMTITEAGNVGIGTITPNVPLQVGSTPSDTAGNVGISLKDKDNAIEFGLRLDATSKDLHIDRYFNGAWAGSNMVFDRSTGNVGIGGVPAPTLGGGLYIETSGYTAITLKKGAEGQGHAIDFNDENNALQYRIGTNFASGGERLIFNCAGTGETGIALKINADRTVRFGVAGTGTGVFDINVGLANSGLVLDFIDEGGTRRFQVADDGDVANTGNSYGAISDVKLKENISDSASQWDDIKAIRVRKYSFKSDNLDAANQLGVIAQEVESAGMNGLVKSTQDEIIDENQFLEDGETENSEYGTAIGMADTYTKSVKYSILYMKAVKALQEAMTRIETLETKVAALEG